MAMDIIKTSEWKGQQFCLVVVGLVSCIGSKVRYMFIY